MNESPYNYPFPFNKKVYDLDVILKESVFSFAEVVHLFALFVFLEGRREAV